MQIDLSWMAWTWETAVFFVAIGVILVVMTTVSLLWPAAPRAGVLGIETTPGDRLFVSLLGSAYICLVALYLFGPPLWWALAACVAFSAVVFRWA